MARLLKYFKCSFHILTLAFLSYFFSQDNINPIIQKKITRYLPDIKHLLIWSTLPGLEGYGQKHFIKKQCYMLNCYFTTNRSLFSDLRYFDGIIFNLQEVSNGIQDLPRVRSKFQKYIFAANDSADNYPVCDPVYDNFFNWTWTYKTNSTIPYHFITIYNTNQEELGNSFNWKTMAPLKEDIMHGHTSKEKAAVIFLDKCKTRSKREDFIKDLLDHLAKYNMSLDVYGKCGLMECRRINMKPCLWRLRKYYYFYLAFEDSLADDFVTKTVLYGYENNAVPIVYGKAVYDRYLPPGSYLNGYELGAQELARTMYHITHDPPRYLQYFKWKTYYSIKSSKVLDACALCSALNNPNWLMYQITFTNFREWWNADYEKRCSERTISPFNYVGFR